MEVLLDIVLPVFAILATGYICGKAKVLGSESSEALNAFVYWVALPALLFGAMARVDLERVYNTSFLAAFAGASIATWVVFSVIGRIAFRLNGAEAALHGLNSSYPNTGYMGIPLAIAAFGPDAALPAIIAMVVSVLSVALAIIPIELSLRRHSSLMSIFWRVAGALARNPMIWAPCAGLVWTWAEIEIPVFAATYLDILGAAAGPCALFSIGLYLVGKPLRDGGMELASMTAAKLVVQPALTSLFILFFFPTNPLWASVAILVAALPIGSGPFVLAQAHGIYVRRTSPVMLITTVLSFPTISLVLVLLGYS